MTLVIRNPETLERIEQLSAALGKPVDASIDTAVQEKLERMQQNAPKKIDWDAVREIQESVAAQPIHDRRSVNELFYNEDGLFG